MEALWLTVAPLVFAAGLLGFINWREDRLRPLQSVQVRFGGDVTRDAVIALLGGISGLSTGAKVLVDVLADEHGISHRLRAQAGTLDSLRSQLRGVLPGVRFEPVEDSDEPQWASATSLRWAGAHPVLQHDHAEETAAALLGAMADLKRGERLLLRWTLTAGSRPHLPQAVDDRNQKPPLLARWLFGAPPRPEHLQALRNKYSGPTLRSRAIVASTASSERRRRRLVDRTVVVLRSRQGSWGRLIVKRRRSEASIARLLSDKARGRSNHLSVAELAGLLGWPLDSPRIPGLTLGTAPQLMPPPNLPRKGRVFARSDWPGLEKRALAQPAIGGLSHALIVGPTGSGKSHLMTNLIAQDLVAGRGCLVLDGKGDLANDVLARIPEKRQADVIVLDPGAGTCVPGLRVFAKGGDPELTADLILAVFRDLFADSWGIRSDRWLRAGLVTLAHDPEATLASFPFLFSDDAYRRRLVGRLDDPLLIATWSAFEAMGPRERAAQISAPLGKVSDLIGRRVVRGALAQTEPKLDMRSVLEKGQVVVVSLSPGRIGGPAARLLGALVVHELFKAVQSRAGRPAHRRRPFFAYVDEPKVLGDLPVPIDSLFELARGLGVGLTLGVQSLGQLPAATQSAALTNAATIIAFKQAADDASLLAREMPVLSGEELQHLGRFAVAARLGLGPGDTAPVATGVTLPLPEPSSNPGRVRRESSERWGVELAAVDAALMKRHGRGTVRATGLPARAPEAPVGRVRRQP